MNQVQRDLTYRREAVEKVCEQNGYESQICQESMQIWESQHNMNLLSARFSFYAEIIFVIMGLLVFGYFLFFRFLKPKTGADKK